MTDTDNPSLPESLNAVYEAALKLSADERELLVTMLRQDEHDTPQADEITQAWIEESNRRLQLIAEGKAGWVDGELALKQLRESITK